jgi:drug/metabolite transporter (DMT)-like permease
MVIALIASGDPMVVEVVWQDGVVIPLLCLGLFGSLACILMLNVFQKYLNPTHAAIIYSFEPVWATIYGWSEGMVEVSLWLTMGLLLLLGNIIVEMDESADGETHLSEDAGPE